MSDQFYVQIGSLKTGYEYTPVPDGADAWTFARQINAERGVTVTVTTQAAIDARAARLAEASAKAAINAKVQAAGEKARTGAVKVAKAVIAKASFDADNPELAELRSNAVKVLGAHPTYKNYRVYKMAAAGLALTENQMTWLIGTAREVQAEKNSKAQLSAA